RLAHRAATRFQLAREMYLPQMRPGRDRPVDDGVAQHAVDLLERRRSFDRGEVPHLRHSGASCQIDLQTDIWENRAVRTPGASAGGGESMSGRTDVDTDHAAAGGLTREELLKRAAVGGGAIIVGGSLAGVAQGATGALAAAAPKRGGTFRIGVSGG